MSMKYMVLAMSAKVGNPLRKLVLIKLADNANDEGECWPSYQYIADQCEMSKRSVITHLDQLVADGLVKKDLRKGPKRNTSNLYTLDKDKMISAGDAPLTDVKDAGDASDGAGDAPMKGAGDAPRICHSFESTKEPREELTLGKATPEQIEKLFSMEHVEPYDERKRFRMNLEWAPEPDAVKDKCNRLCVNLSRYPRSDIQTSIQRFIVHHDGKGTINHENGWLSMLALWLQRDAVKWDAKPNQPMPVLKAFPRDEDEP